MHPSPAPGGGWWYSGHTFGTESPIIIENGFKFGFTVGCPSAGQPKSGWTLIPYGKWPVTSCTLIATDCDPFTLVFEFTMQYSDMFGNTAPLTGTVTITEAP